MDIQRLVAILSLTTQQETTDFLWDKRRRKRNFLPDFIKQLGLDSNYRSDFQRVRALEKYFDDIRNKKTDDSMMFECIGCGGTSEASGLRWKKLNEGKPLTVSIDHSGKPRGLSWLGEEEIMSHWFQPWTVDNPKIKFRLLTRGRGDCHITFEPIDGPENVLKFVWQPDQSVEFMESGGELSGNMVCDSSEIRYPIELTRMAGKHEVGHVLGLGHLKNKNDVMYEYANGVVRPLSKNDLKERDKRYPIEQSTTTVAA